MRTAQRIGILFLLVLIGATIYGLVRTGEPVAPLAPDGKNSQTASGAGKAPLVDQTPLKTAQELARLVSAPEEQPLAKEALRLADYEVDLTFDAALHEAKRRPPILRGEAKEIQEHLQKAQRIVEDEKKQVAQLTEALAKAKDDEKKRALEDDLAIAQEDLNLAQAEVDDAKQDLIRAGGDPEDRIQELYKEHKDAEGENAKAIPSAALPAQTGLVHRFQQWWTLHEKQLLLWKAKQAAEIVAAALSKQHDALDAQIEAEKAATPQLAHHSKKSGADARASAPAPRSREESATLLQKTKQIAEDQTELSGYDKRIETEKELAGVYGQWIGIVAAEQRGVVHGVMTGILIILAIALVGLYFDAWLEKLLSRLALERRRVETLRTVTRASVRVVAILFILLVIFGPPGQLATVLGLAGAGLTVALKDFIVGFIGWFVLMGKNGIRLGDWVEINGVSGEVVEIGLFHTVLLETGNWTDAGHPTGRRVTFTNSFAIEGHYFNFSTSGQWLWDELHVVLPADRDPFPIIDAIRKKVLEATQESARQAEQEWQRAARSREMSSFSAGPAISLKPVVGGVEVAVRYVTRANERYQLRAKLYQAAVELMGGRSAPLATAAPS